MKINYTLYKGSRDTRGRPRVKGCQRGCAALTAAAAFLCAVMMSGAPVYAAGTGAAEYTAGGALSAGILPAAVTAVTTAAGSGARAAAALQSTGAAMAGSLQLPAETTSATAVSTEQGDVTRTESESASQNVKLQKRIYSGDGIGDCTVYMERLTAEKDTESRTITVFQLGEGDGTIRSYDALSDSWTVSPLSEGTLANGMYFIKTGNSESIFITPQTYISRTNGMIESLPSYNGSMRISYRNGRYYLTVSAPALQADMFCDFTALCSGSPLVDWNSSDAVSKWENYRFTDDNRWCYDGYYYKSPASYIPSGTNYYYKLPAAYITGKMAKNKDDQASRALCLAMIDVMKARYNASGYIPSENGSEWLLEEYNIEAGYFDTRFNTDFALAMVNAAENFGAAELIEGAAVYGKFLVSYAAGRHFTVGSGESEGWLVDDYWNETGSPRRTHVSLNHQAAEAVFLYKLSNATGDETYAETAEKLVMGIENTADKWIMPDGNLYYSYGNDASMKTGDYPYLTYNDLLELQRLYTARHGSENTSLAKLLSSKLAWMNASGVTQYDR